MPPTVMVLVQPVVHIVRPWTLHVLLGTAEMHRNQYGQRARSTTWKTTI